MEAKLTIVWGIDDPVTDVLECKWDTDNGDAPNNTFIANSARSRNISYLYELGGYMIPCLSYGDYSSFSSTLDSAILGLNNCRLSMIYYDRKGRFKLEFVDVNTTVKKFISQANFNEDEYTGFFKVNNLRVFVANGYVIEQANDGSWSKRGTSNQDTVIALLTNRLLSASGNYDLTEATMDYYEPYKEQIYSYNTLKFKEVVDELQRNFDESAAAYISR